MIEFENAVFQLIINHQPNAMDYVKKALGKTIVDLEGRSPLHMAIAYKNSKVCEFLIKNMENLDSQDFDGSSALHFAAAHQDFKNAQMLLNYGATLDIIDKHGNTPLWTAVLRPRVNYEMVKEFVSRGANFNNKNMYSLSPLDMAHRKEDETLLKIFH